MGDHTDKEWLRKQYHELDKSQTEIAQEQDVTQQRISYWVRKFDLSKEKYVRNQISEQWLREQYCELGRTQKEIAQEKGVSQPHISLLLRKFDLSKRT
ncbi:hypothetical protein 7865G3C4_2 [Haloquadratum phage sp.]|jgi:predicted transcriptional regulator|nr:hypothetical protein 7865G3C4_2 [Haloquadratum phage sp.]